MTTITFFVAGIIEQQCVTDVPLLRGVKKGYFLTGKLGRAWVGAWVEYGMVHGW